MYYVTVMNTWAYDPETGERIPATGRDKRPYTIAKNIENEKDAQQIVRDYNQTHTAGPLGRRASYEAQRRK